MIFISKYVADFQKYRNTRLKNFHKFVEHDTIKT